MVVTSPPHVQSRGPADHGRRQDRVPPSSARKTPGHLPFHPGSSAFVPKDPWKTASDPGGFKAAQRTDSQLAVLVLAYDSRSKGNAATEMVKYFLQLHYGIKKDYRNFYLLKSHFTVH